MMREMLVLGCAALLASCGTPTWQQSQSTNKPRKNVVVQFSDATLHPQTARITQGGNVAWIDYASGVDGSVVFPESIRESFTCDDLRPLFMKVAAGYQSIPISESSSEEVTLPCPLKAGEYDYELYLFSPGAFGGMGRGAGMADPQSVMKGKIIVE